MAQNDKLRRFRQATAHRLRANQTSAEQRLWRNLDRIPLLRTHFRRQAPIGPYVADFACLRAKLLIEVDGPSHAEPGAAERDLERTRWLEREGYRVLRFWNDEVFENIDGVLDTIYAALYGSLATESDAGVTPPRPAPQSDPPRSGEGERH
jgi:very-short-patch-repair endonuclease